MIRQLAERDARRQPERNRGGERVQKRARLAAVLVVAIVFVAGFLLARRRAVDVRTAEVADARAKISDTMTRARGRAVPGEAETGNAGGATDDQLHASDHAMTEAERERKREQAASLFASTSRGMPTLGVGTYDDANYDDCYATVRQALRIGYRHIDTVEHRESYYNETAVGEALDDADAPREDLFVTTKVHPGDLASNHVRHSVDESLDRLGLDYLDLLYVHWPTDEYDPVDTMNAFAKLREEGVIERIGVSNFTVDLLEEALAASDAPIFANQVEMHPLLPQRELREFCASDDVDVELVGYSPIARGDVEDVSELQVVAAKHDATPEQVSLAWLREKGVTAIPRATTEDHLLENWLSLGLELDEEDVETLDSIDERRRIVDRPDAPWNQ